MNKSKYTKCTLISIALFCKLLTLILVWAFSSPINAQTTLNVWLTSGGVENYSFSETLFLQASSETELTLTSGTLEVIYPIANIRKLTINDAEAERIAASVSAPSAQEGGQTAVYDMSGKEVLRLQRNVKNATDVNLSELPSGIYIVRSVNTQFKVLVK